MMISDTKSNVLQGVGVGAVMATLYSLFVLVVFLVSGSDAFDKYETSLPIVVVTYYASGILGGATIGAFLPMAKHFLGRIVLGIIGGLIVFFCIVMAMEGPFWNWSSTDWETVAFAGVVMGGIAGAFWRRATGW